MLAVYASFLLRKSDKYGNIKIKKYALDIKKYYKIVGEIMEIVDKDIIDVDNETKEVIIDKLLEDEKCIKKGERTYTREEMNAIIDWTMSRYV